MISGMTSVEGTDQFLQLLVTQLQNQDPLDPVGQEEFIGQLAQLSTLSGIEELNGSFANMVSQQSDLIRLQELTVGSSLLGQQVEYFEEGSSELRQATVEKLSVVDGHVLVDVGNDTITLNQVLNIRPSQM